MYVYSKMGLFTCRLYILFIIIIQLNYIHCDKHSSIYSRHPYDILKVVHGIVRQSHESNNLQSMMDSNLDLDDFNFFAKNEPAFLLEDSFNLGDSMDHCFHDILYIFESLKSVKTPWALQMFDAYGKVGSGVLRGNLKWPGDFAECLSVYAPPKENSSVGNFHGQYCSLQWSAKLSNYTLSAMSGICVPDSCSSSELKDYFHVLSSIIDIVTFSNKNSSIFNVTSIACNPATKHLTTSAIAVICLLSCFVLLALIGSGITAYEYFFKKGIPPQLSTSCIINGIEPSAPNKHNSILHHDQDADDDPLIVDAKSKSFMAAVFEKCKPFFKCFCLFTNGSKLLNVDSTEGQLLSVHGIRFLSMTWVILGHTYAFSFTSVGNLLDIGSMVDKFAFQIILQGFFSVDSFFVLSGFLLTYLFFQEFAKKNGKINWFYFYLHRYIRLTPVYMLVLGFSSTIYFYLGSGPFWPEGVLDEVCKDSWWWNLLYINNFLKSGKMCMAWSWYLANDMQFYVISPLILITLWRWPKIAYSLLVALLIGTWAANFGITYYYDLFPGVSNIATVTAAHPQNLEDFTARFADYFDKLYIKPYTRIGPYLVGMLLGYLLFKAKTNRQRKFHPVELWFGWVVASAITLTCVYGLYHRDLSLLASSFYNAFNRTCFAAGLSWVIFVCLTDQGGPVNSILSYKLFIPLSRLTYSAYLIHPLILTGYFASLKAPLVITNATMVILFLGFIVATYGLSMLVSLIFESPVIALEKLFRSKFSKT